MQRRDFVAGVFGLFGGAAMVGSSSMDLSERLSWAVRHPATSIDDRIVDQLERITIRLAELRDETVDPSLLMHPIEAHLQLLIDQVKHMQSSPLHHRLCSLASETAVLAGWLRWNLGQYRSAEDYFWGAVKAAEEAGDQALAAYGRGCVASRPFHREDPRRRLDVLSTAVGATPQTTAWLYILAAGAHALEGRVADFHWAANQAREALERVEDVESRRPRTPFFDRVYLEEEAAAGCLRLNMPAMAHQGLASVRPQASGRMQMWVDLDLALASADQGLPDMAVTYARHVLEAARTNHVQPILRSLRALPDRPSMRPTREAVILEEALRLA